MPYRKISILLTRPVEEAVIQRAAAYGIDIEVIPFIRTIPGPPELIAGQAAGLPSDAIAIFTSTAAVRAAAPFLQPARVFCIAGATQQAVRSLMPGAAILGTADTAAELSEKILAHGGIAEVHFFCGDLHLPTLPSRLEAGGIRVMKHLTYRTEQTPVPVERHFDGIAFFSPSAVSSYLSLNRIDPDTAVFAIGGTTAGSLQAHGCVPIASPSPHAEAMLDTIIQFYHSGPVLNPNNNA